jgi:hypothetical protein
MGDNDIDRDSFGKLSDKSPSKKSFGNLSKEEE